MTIGPATYYSGPSWRLPDGPIVGLNYQGTLSLYQANGDAELNANGQDMWSWIPSPVIGLTGGTGTNFDSCGSWLVRALTAPDGTVLGFYHAETACTYSLNGQTRKSGGYAVSTDGGKTFSKPNYPNNKLCDTKSPIISGIPSGEGDISVIVRDGYYYLFFNDVEDYHTGIARSPISSDAYPGSFLNYFDGAWNTNSVGGNSSRIANIAGSYAYLHTPSQSVVSVGNNNPYWDQGFQMSVSDDFLNWQYFADPIFTPDPVTNMDTIMYPSFLGPTGGYDIGSDFQFFYMWIAPGSDWNHRYQIMKSVSMSYVGQNYEGPLVQIALTTFRALSTTGETWQSTELALPPYTPVNILGYVMSRPYPNTFVVYDCYNYTTKDHFVGTAAECFLSGSGIEVLRTLGYMYSFRAYPTLAVYRCYAGTDLFLSTDPNCEGLAPSESVPFGYVLDGPALDTTSQVLIGQGSTWEYFYGATPPSTWTQLNFQTNGWLSAAAPFSDSYSVQTTYFGTTNYYFRQTFTIPAGQTVSKLLVSVASDDYADVYINGNLVDSDVVTWHEAAYWNRRVYVPVSYLTTGTNMLAIEVFNMDIWAFFDCQLTVVYTAPISQSKRSVKFEEPVEEELPTLTKVPSSAKPQVLERKETRSSSTVTLVPAGSTWRFFNQSAPVSSWTTQNFDDSSWMLGLAPFVTGYSAYVGVGTPFGTTNYYFRYDFNIPSGVTVSSMQVSIASDNYGVIYINGQLVDSDPSSWHQATYWNRQVNVAPNLVTSGSNTIAVVVMNMDQWAFFDLQLTAVYAATSLPTGTLIAAGSTWLYYNVSAPPSSWTTLNYDDSQWKSSLAPFVTGYSAYVGVGTPFGPTDYYFRYKFTIPAGSTVTSMQVNVASDNYGIVYINGQLVDSDPSSWHQATYWNRQVQVSTSILTSGVNIMAVVVKNMDQWAFFDLQLTAVYASALPPTPTPTPSPTPPPNNSPQGTVTAIAKGTDWLYYTSSPPSGWNAMGFDDSKWQTGIAPFVTGYSAYAGVGTPFGTTNYYFRQYFTVASGSTLVGAQVSIASDNYGIVYINGQLVDSDPSTWHVATYWNRQVSVDPSLFNSGTNVLAVVVMNQDQWAFFDAQLTLTYQQQTLSNGVLVQKGSNWKFYNQSTPANTWIQPSFDDSQWMTSIAPFVTGYSAYAGVGTPFGMTNYYFRAKFTIPAGNNVQTVQLNVASDNYGIVYINGVLVDSDPASWHQAQYWNRQISVNPSVLITGSNTIAVVVMNQDQWAFFDLQLTATYGSKNLGATTQTCTPACGVKGQCNNGQCVCDNGWGGADCNTNLCTYSGTTNSTIIPRGSQFRNLQWSTVASTPSGWFAPSYDDSWWQLNNAPFGTTYYSGVTTTIQGYRHLYRKKFLIDIPYNQVIESGVLMFATDDTQRVYLNNVFLGDPIFPYDGHYAKYWNAVIAVDGSLLSGISNEIAVEVPLADGRWTAFFDMQLIVTFATKTCSAP